MSDLEHSKSKKDHEFEHIVDACLEQVGPEEQAKNKTARRRAIRYMPAFTEHLLIPRHRRPVIVLGAFAILNLIAYLMLSGDSQPTSRSQADSELRLLYGDSYEHIEALKGFLSPSRRFYSPSDPAFTGAVRDLNHTFYRDSAFVQRFSSEYFFFLGRGIIYTEPVRRK